MHLVNKRMPHIVTLAVSALAVATSPSRADWKGSEVNRDGAIHVMNPSTSIEPASTKTAKELWRVGGDDEDVLFGVITSVAADAEGLIYLLDAQINVVHVFSPDGRFLREIGREGEGPGEFRRAESILVTGEGNIAVMQGMPGKIIQLSPAGEPLENYKLPGESGTAPMRLTGGVLAGDQLVLNTVDFTPQDDGFIINDKIIRLNRAGEVTATYTESTRKASMANMTFDEKRDAPIVFTAGSDGRVFIHNDWDKYEISVHRAGGELDRVIEREYKPRKRTDEEKERNKPRAFVRAEGGTRELEAVVAETDRQVREMFAREDGTLWVINGRGAADSPDEAVATFDVFDRKGQFVREVTVEGDGDFAEDGFHFVGDKLIIVKDLRSSRRAMFASLTGGDDTEAEDVEPLSVICYDISNIVSARN